MRSPMRRLASRVYESCVWRVALAVFATAPGVAAAALGGNVSSVEADRAHMKAQLVRSEAALFTVHQLQTANGTTVRELVSAAGVVFAVTWKGPFLPDLRQTLGTYFPSYEAAPRAGNSGHSHFAVQRADLVVLSRGHLRAYSGLAYVPSLVPTGLTIDQLQ
ncbi:MAG: hypothetical protein JWM63_735 [Gammaproteobacteria bacterium]|nr:hypothetical protein [Gammaproteobacteria bacterium]